jgi:hypothetical protein
VRVVVAILSIVCGRQSKFVDNGYERTLKLEFVSISFHPGRILVKSAEFIMLSLSRKNRRTAFLAALLSGCLLGQSLDQLQAQAPPAAAPAFDAIPLAEEFKTDKGRRELLTAKNQVLKGEVAFSTQPIEAYYKKVLMAELTSSVDAAVINQTCNEIRNDIMSATKKLDKDSLKQFNMSLATMFNKIAKGNFRPTATINCVILLGLLDEAPAQSSSPAKPFREAFMLLPRFATDSKVNDGIRAAALAALDRQVQIYGGEWNATQREELADKLVQSMIAPKPAYQTESAHAYLVARQLRLLGQFTHNKSADINKFVVDVLANEHSHNILREQALVAFGAFAPEDDPQKIAAAGRYTMRYMKERLEGWNELLDMATTAGGSGGGAGDSGYGGAGAMGGYAGGAAAAGMSGYGGGGGAYGAKTEVTEEDNKPKELDAQTKLLRRYLHEVAQNLRAGFSGEMKGPIPAKFEKGLLAALPSGKERTDVEYSLTLLRDIQGLLNDEKIESKADLDGVAKVVNQLIATANGYPGVIIDGEDPTAILQTGTEVADGSQPVNPAVAITPDES